MPTIADTKLVSKPVPWISPTFSGLAVVLLLFDGAVKLVPWPIVTETMDRMTNGSSETPARGLGLISIVCTALYAVPPTSIVGAILWTGYLGGAVASHVRMDGPLFSHILLGVYLGVTVWSGTGCGMETCAYCCRSHADVSIGLNHQKERTMSISPYLFYDGKCEAAFKFYEEVLGGKIEAMLTFDSAPESMPVSPEWKKKIMHATMTIDGQTLMGSDPPPAHFQKPQGFAVSLQLNDAAEAERKFNALAAGGTVSMPFGKTFWSKGFGMCADQFGISWMVNVPQA